MSKKREEREKLLATMDFVVVAAVQKRPYTAIVLEGVYAHNDGRDVFTYTGTGFSKVCWPDDWDENLGRRIAWDKARADIGKKIQLDIDNEEIGLRAEDHIP